MFRLEYSFLQTLTQTPKKTSKSKRCEKSETVVLIPKEYSAEIRCALHMPEYFSEILPEMLLEFCQMYFNFSLKFHRTSAKFSIEILSTFHQRFLTTIKDPEEAS